MSREAAGMEAWAGDLVITGERILSDLKFSHEATDASPGAPTIPAGSLRFLAVVDPNRIPLHLAVGPNFKVTSSSVDTIEWLFNVFQCNALKSDENGLVGEAAEADPHPSDVNQQSEVAVLAKFSAVEDSNESHNAASGFPRITEILLYAVGNGYSNSFGLDVLPGYDVYALPLSSDLLYAPSTYPNQECHVSSDARYFPSSELHIAPEYTQVAKKERLDDLFDAASDRRKKAKRKGGQIISLAASRGNAALQSPAFDSRIIKNEDEPSLERPQQPSLGARNVEARRIIPTALVPARPPSRAAGTEHTKTSLSQSVLQGNGFEDNSFEIRNRQVISRTVMAGMRIYGLQQRKKDLPRPQVPSQSQQSEHAFESQVEVAENDKEQGDSDAEYKAVYHQTYKGAVFTLRHRITSELLPPEVVREVVDRLLALFCEERV